MFKISDTGWKLRFSLFFFSEQRFARHCTARTLTTFFLCDYFELKFCVPIRSIEGHVIWRIKMIQKFLTLHRIVAIDVINSGHFFKLCCIFQRLYLQYQSHQIYPSWLLRVHIQLQRCQILFFFFCISKDTYHCYLSQQAFLTTNSQIINCTVDYTLDIVCDKVDKTCSSDKTESIIL